MSTFTISGKTPGRLGKEVSKFRQKSISKGKRQLLAFFFCVCACSNVAPIQQQFQSCQQPVC